MSFLATAVLTFIAIVVGYLSDSLPDTSLNQLDRACIIKFSSIRWRPWVKDGPISVLLRRSMTTAMGVMGWGSAVADHDNGLEDDDISIDARQRRSRGLGKFILALSDQQLVTGLAVLIAGFVSPCSMSMYHFNIIAALGWFSSTTHLSTLAVLRVYFIEHPRLRNWRVVAMLFVLALLITAQVVTGASTLDNSLPVRCAFTQSSSSTLTLVDPITIAAIIVFLVGTYSDRIVRLYILDPEWSLQAWSVDVVVMVLKNWLRLGKRQQYTGRELVKIVIETTNKTKAEQGVLWRRLNERRRYKRYYSMLRSQRSVLPRRMRLIRMMMTEIKYSFLGDLFTLQFGVVLGITQVIISRINEPSAGLEGSQNDINFGQLVPLLLLLLPLLTVGEVYFGNNDNLYAYGLVLTALIVERHEDMSTKPSNDKTTSANKTHGNPFFSRKIGFPDLIGFSYSTQPTLDNTSLTVDASSLLPSLRGVPPNVGGSTEIEFQNLPTGRPRRLDTETGLRVPMRDHSGLTRTPPRSPVAEVGIYPAITPKKPPSPWFEFSVLFTCFIIAQILLAIILGGALRSLYTFAVIFIIMYASAVVLNIFYSIYLGLEGLENQ